MALHELCLLTPFPLVALIDHCSKGRKHQHVDLSNRKHNNEDLFALLRELLPVEQRLALTKHASIRALLHTLAQRVRRSSSPSSTS
eukprot:CAMPEP_0174245536 /NCGR_PEP_ID=MMETSP0417-20130205/39536_1 /TAXON_ID=242541 /ORGANISM="Mayorella sp, Strain BSH-02190019" /LENGTH=85 /DNA_ID=CAMNT_0015325333 /DNA_START=11 /DNA_END=264 /DNA_ORIENTATION=+